MPDDRITLDVFHVVILAPADMPDREHSAMVRTLDRAAFRRLLRKAATYVCRKSAGLARATVRVTR